MFCPVLLEKQFSEKVDLSSSSVKVWVDWLVATKCRAKDDDDDVDDDDDYDR